MKEVELVYWRIHRECFNRGEWEVAGTRWGVRLAKTVAARASPVECLLGGQKSVHLTMGIHHVTRDHPGVDHVLEAHP